MRIFITGSTGLVGSSLLANPELRKHELICPNSKRVNLIDSSEVFHALFDRNIDMVIHCAGKVGGIAINQDKQFEFLYHNLTMGLNLLRFATQAGIKKLINLSSSCIYPIDAPRPLKEESVLGGKLEPTNEGYAIAKSAVLKACEYANREGFEYKTFIPCNLYGENDNFNEYSSHFIPAIVRKIYKFATNNNIHSVEIWGDGSPLREVMHADDLANFIAFAVENWKAIPDLMNVGTGREDSILDYHEQAFEAIVEHKPDKNVFKFNKDFPNGVHNKVMDVTKQKALGWMPKISFKEGIKKVYDCYAQKQKDLC